MKILIILLLPIVFLINKSNAQNQLPAAYYKGFELIEANNLFRLSYKVEQDKLYKGKSLETYVEHRFILSFYIQGQSLAEINLKQPLTIELEVGAGKETKKIEIPLTSINGSKIESYRVAVLATQTPFAKALSYKIDYKD